MRVAVIGHGRMGREVEAALIERGHEPVIVKRAAGFPHLCPVGIDFTQPEAVLANTRRALEAGARYVVGTTGWSDAEPEMRELVTASRGGLVHAANFSLGVNLFYQVVRHAAALLAHFPDYDPYIVEKHHRKKRDAPSGTARVLAGFIAWAALQARTWLERGLALFALVVIRLMVADSESRREAQARAQQDARFRSLVLRSSDAFLIVSSDGMVSYASPSFATMVGSDIAEVVGRGCCRPSGAIALAAQHVLAGGVAFGW